MVPTSVALRLLLFACGAFGGIAHAQFNWVPLAPLPGPTTNHAFCTAEVFGTWHAYVFGGIGSGLSQADITRNAYRYDAINDQWTTLPEVPDSLGVIASAASVVGDTAYMIGGYHVFNGPPYEASSNAVHRLDLTTNSWLSDGASIPIPIDDQVQAVWRDSLIYVVTGLSNTANVAHVQVYNPALDSWASATPVPNTAEFKAFGAGGIIIGDTLFYLGGASSSGNFPAQDKLRIGVIDPLDPLTIAWQPTETCPLGARYRPGAVDLNGTAAWIGGSQVSYNFDAIAYNGSGIVAPATQVPTWLSTWGETSGSSASIMDIRGIGRLGENRWMLAGGIGNNAHVLDQAWLIELPPAGIEDGQDVRILSSPDPANDRLNIHIQAEVAINTFSVLDAWGREILHGADIRDDLVLNTSAWPSGMYVFRITANTGSHSQRFVVAH